MKYRIADYWQRPATGLIKRWDNREEEFSCFDPATNELCIVDVIGGWFLDAWHLKLDDAVVEYWDVLTNPDLSLRFDPGKEIVWGDSMAIGEFRSAAFGAGGVDYGWNRVDLQGHYAEMEVCGHKHCDVIALAVTHLPDGSQDYRWVDFMACGFGSIRRTYYDENWRPTGTISVTKWVAA